MIVGANPSAQFQSYKNEIEKAVLKVLNSNRYVLGNEVSGLEKEFSEFIGTKYCIGVANGTDAIELSLRALEIGSGDEVITVSHTAVATVAAIIATGAKPVLVDINEENFTIDIHKLSKAINKKTRAIIPVHIYGQSSKISEIKKICKIKKIFLIEDVSQAHGAYHNNKRLGSFGDIACFSCYPTKNLGAIGDAGLITTNNNKIEKKIRMLREYGWSKRYISEFNGRNSRIDEIQAAILRIKLKNLDKDNNKRRKIADYYYKNIDALKYELPKISRGNEHVFHLFVIKSKKRNKLLKHLKSKNIYAGIHYPLPIHLQKGYSKLVKISGKLNNTETVSKLILSLPIYPELSIHDQKKIVHSLNFFKF